MGRGRAPCCDKSKVKKGPWSPAEDLRLISFIHNHGHSNWRSLPKLAGLLRCGKSCRLRWINYLRPDLKRGNFTKEEEETIIKLHHSLGNKWSKIASYFPGRTDNEIKNVWNTHLKKRLIKKNADADADADDDHVAINDHNDEVPKLKQFSRTASSCSSSSSSSLRPQSQSQSQSHQVCNMEEEKKQEISSSSSSPSSIEVDNAVAMAKYHEVNNLMSLNSSDDQELRIEIPLESDIDLFWDMLDNLEPNESHSQPQEFEFEFEASHNSQDSSNSFREDLDDHDHDHDHGKWLRYLENELGLADQATSSDHHGQLVSSSDDDDQMMLMMRPEIDDHGMCYFSPQNFGI